METDRRTMRAVRKKALYCASRLGYLPDIANPKTYNEKLLRRMFQRPDSIMGTTADKVRVKAWLAEAKEADPELASLNIIPTLWSGTGKPDWNSIEYPCIVKASHGWSMHKVLDRAPGPDEIPALNRQIAKWLCMRFPARKHEPQYELIKPQILIEPLIEDNTDYKFYVFGGRVEMTGVFRDRAVRKIRDWLDRDWQPMPFTRLRGSSRAPAHAPELPPVERPANLDLILRLAERLTGHLGEVGHEFVRVDMYISNGRVYFGELTWTPAGGQTGFQPVEWDRHFGELFKINLKPMYSPYGKWRCASDWWLETAERLHLRPAHA
jgi:hypothetical protein